RLERRWSGGAGSTGSRSSGWLQWWWVVTEPIPADSAGEKLDRGLGKVEGVVRGLGARPIGREAAGSGRRGGEGPSCGGAARLNPRRKRKKMKTRAGAVNG